MFFIRSWQIHKVCAICFMLALLMMILAAGQTLSAAAGVMASAPSQRDPETPIHAALTLQTPAALDQPVELTCQVSSTQDAPTTTAQIELPDNVALRQGSLTWQGDLAANQPIEIAVTVIFTAPGDTAILCRARQRLDARNSWGDLREGALYGAIPNVQGSHQKSSQGIFTSRGACPALTVDKLPNHARTFLRTHHPITRTCKKALFQGLFVRLLRRCSRNCKGADSA